MGGLLEFSSTEASRQTAEGAVMGEDSSAELVFSNWILTEWFVTPEVAPNIVHEVFTMGMLHFFPCAKRLND